jgi:NADPH:quinone reductase-like Zn-dependent oxidoreductase
MKAAMLPHYGAPEEFQIKELKTPQIKDGQLLILNKASSVNPVDVLIRQGKLELITGIIGDQLIGCDFSGVIIESKSEFFKAGDEVYGMNPVVEGGAYAENIIADENSAAIKPQNLSFRESGVLPMVSLTAWQALVDKGNLEQNDKVLILGCTGGVGISAVQIAKSFSATVTGTCSTENVEFAKALGIDHVIDYKTEQIDPAEKFDLIFDASGNYTISDMQENLTDDAFFVSTRAGMNDIKSVFTGVTDLAFKEKMKMTYVKPDRAVLTILSGLAEKGQLKPYIAKTFSLSEIAQGHQFAENGGSTGKIAIEI